MGGTGSGRRAGYLSPRKARAIYAAAHGPNTTRVIARFFGVSPRTVLNIKHRRAYVAETSVPNAALDAALFNYIVERVQARGKVAA